MVEGEGDAVGYLNPLLAISSIVNVSLPGQQPDLTAAVEDMRLLDDSLVDKSGEGVYGWVTRLQNASWGLMHVRRHALHNTAG